MELLLLLQRLCTSVSRVLTAGKGDHAHEH